MYRKHLSFFLFFLFSSCQSSELFDNYNQISAKWQLDTINGIDIRVKKEINYIDMSVCKFTKRRIKDDNYSCTASINDSEFGGLTINYNLKLKNQIYISQVVNLPSTQTGIVVVGQKTEAEELLSKELLGLWTYTIDANKMIWEKSPQKIIFTKL